jgi:hypothetical protein
MSWVVRSLKTGVICHKSKSKEGAELWGKKFLGVHAEVYRKNDLSLQRASGTCCPEPTCDYERLEYIECESCGAVCSECERMVVSDG